MLPEDVLDDEVTRPLPAPYPIFRPQPSASEIAAVAHALDQARRPLLIAGGALRGEKGAAALADFARAQTVPVAASWKNQDVFDNGSPLYAGHLGVGTPKPHVEALASADLVIAAGTRLGDIASQNYTFPRAPDPGAAAHPYLSRQQAHRCRLPHDARRHRRPGRAAGGAGPP